MRLLQKHGKLKDLGYLLQMATYNGALALGINQQYGSFEPGKKPGILLLKGLDGDTILPKSTVQVIATA
jgi:cytosine/adenosine deaminase-related metal-dependent hydrolase